MQEFLARHFIGQGRNELALRAGLNAIEDHPDYYSNRSISAHVYTGAALHLLGRHKEALPFLENADLRQPGEGSIMSILAISYYHEDRFNDAIHYFDEMERLSGFLTDENSAQREMARSKLENNEHQRQETRKAPGQMLINETVRKNNLIAARRSLESGTPDVALRYVSSLHAIAPDAETHELIATAQMRTGRLGAAEENFRILTEIDPDNAEAVAALGQILALSGRTASAIEHLSRAVALDPLNNRFRDSLAALQEKLDLRCRSHEPALESDQSDHLLPSNC